MYVMITRVVCSSGQRDIALARKAVCVPPEDKELSHTTC